MKVKRNIVLTYSGIKAEFTKPQTALLLDALKATRSNQPEACSKVNFKGGFLEIRNAEAEIDLYFQTNSSSLSASCGQSTVEWMIGEIEKLTSTYHTMDGGIG